MGLSLWLNVLLLASAANAAYVPFDDWSHQRVNLPNVSIHFRYAGSGPPVFLIHGNPQHSVRIVSFDVMVVC